MALTDNEKEKNRKRNKKRAVEAHGFRYSDSQKLEAVQSYLTLGNLALVGRILSIPEITLRVWKASEWWSKAVEEIKLQDKVQLSARMKKIVEASQTIVAQRLESGDPILNQKTGEIVYKPVTLKDAHKVSIDLIDRQHVLDKLTTDNGPTDEKNDDKLEKLAERFAEMATLSIEKQINKRRTIDAEEVEVISALDEEREARLQARVPEVSGDPGANQESFGTDGSPEESQ